MVNFKTYQKTWLRYGFKVFVMFQSMCPWFRLQNNSAFFAFLKLEVLLQSLGIGFLRERLLTNFENSNFKIQYFELKSPIQSLKSYQKTWHLGINGLFYVVFKKCIRVLAFKLRVFLRFFKFNTFWWEFLSLLFEIRLQIYFGV